MSKDPEVSVESIPLNRYITIPTSQKTEETETINVAIPILLTEEQIQELQTKMEELGVEVDHQDPNEEEDEEEEEDDEEEESVDEVLPTSEET